MCGILVIAMPIPIIVNNFTRQYSRLEPVSIYWKRIREEEQAEAAKETATCILPLKAHIDAVNGELEENFQSTQVF